MQIDLGRHGYAATGTQKRRIGINEFRWQKAVPQQALTSAIQVTQNEIEQPRPLDQTRFNSGPFFTPEEQRDEIQAPWPVSPFWIAVGCKSYTVLPNNP